MNIQPSIMRYATIISKVLKVEVEIVDSNLIRVAGTGIYKGRVNKSIEKEGYVYRHAIETGAPQIVEEPGKSRFCNKCTKYGRCEEKFEICAPINFRNETVGVIGLVCFNEEQKNNLLLDFDTYMEFLQQVSYFISTAACESRERSREETLVKHNLRDHILCDDILGRSEQMMKLKKNIKKIAGSSSTVLITGESGTGKEMVAKAIHNEGNRKNGPFVAINCAAIPYELLESELFGYVKGAFTGASPSGRTGKFELANYGTIFLDEIGDMPLPLQIKLLRVLQDRRIVRIGSNKPVDVDVRVIAASNRDLVELIAEKKFREDLYYRLNVIPFNIPPLRDRLQDIDVLVMHFIDKYSKILNKKFSSIYIDPRVWEVFYVYSWPGNVRELENTIEYMINMMDDDGKFTLDALPDSILGCHSRPSVKSDGIRRLEDIEKSEIIKALEIFGNDTRGKRIAAQKLGIGIATLYRKIEEYGL